MFRANCLKNKWYMHFVPLFILLVVCSVFYLHYIKCVKHLKEKFMFVCLVGAIKTFDELRPRHSSFHIMSMSVLQVKYLNTHNNREYSKEKV